MSYFMVRETERSGDFIYVVPVYVVREIVIVIFKGLLNFGICSNTERSPTVKVFFLYRSDEYKGTPAFVQMIGFNRIVLGKNETN